jgi:hypothetical protein
MGKLVAYDLTALPAASIGTPPKHTPSELDAYIKVIQSGRAAGDGENYADKKLAQAAASSVKRGLKKYQSDLTIAMRVWEADGAWHFALRPFTPPVPKVETPLVPKAE